MPVLEGGGRVDVRSLEEMLRARTEAEVRFEAGSRAAYATDASNYRRVPMGVVVPRTTDDVVNAIAVCREHRVPIVSRGGGTSLNGQCCTHGVVMDCSKHLNQILEIDVEGRRARVQPGVVLDSLNDQIRDRHGVAFGPDPSTHSHCTFGGMLGNNSCGVHSVLAGHTADNVEAMEVVTSDGVRLSVGETDEAAFRRHVERGGRVGEIYAGLRSLRQRYAEEIRRRYPDIPRRVSGYNLASLLDERCNVARSLVGSEGTCVGILEATLRLVEWPRERVLLVLGYSTVYEAADHVVEVMEAGPVGLEGLDERLVEYMRIKGMHRRDVDLLPDGSAWLLVEFGGETREAAEDPARRLMERLGREARAPSMELLDDPKREEMIWKVRESGLGATAFIPGMDDTWPGWEDASIPPDQLGRYLRAFRKLLKRHAYECSLYGHFGQGCVHCRINFDLVTPSGIERYRSFVDEAADLVLEHGGSLSAEHGDGLSKSELLPKMFGESLMRAFGEFKALWDPDGIMNPGKIAATPPIDTDLRLGPAYRPRRFETKFSYPNDGDRMFERAAIRCVGVGKCRRRDNVFMCPSYVATQEELDTTRGRARLLFEMTRGDVIADGWRSQGVRDSLDLCLACKGCKKECPVNVDMATYKSEFLYHHYKGRLRPRSFYAMGFIGAMADVAAVAPALANFAGSAPGISSMVKRCAGIDPGRDMPRFAARTFRTWFARRRERTGATRGEVLLIPDAFNDHFHPGTLRAAVVVLEKLGFGVRLPAWRYPAIRPLIHYGFLDRAQRLLGTVLNRLDQEAAGGTPIIGVEPSTLAVLRDEASGLFPASPVVRRISRQAKLLSEFLAERCLDDLPATGGRCIFHAHCHQKAVLDPDGARRVLDQLGYDVHEPEPGCCGMAGSFGFERDHAPLSRRIGEQRLLPAVRAAARDERIIIEGFSCREQIMQETAIVPTHLAELVAESLAYSYGPPLDGDTH